MFMFYCLVARGEAFLLSRVGKRKPSPLEREALEFLSGPDHRGSCLAC